ncbi:MAG: hypothetical protein KDC11_10110 [Chitinophagaceae bacterium]|nr:hypothetical protein [Chitinophagaceae bacterium]
MRILMFCLLILMGIGAKAQDGLFATEKPEAKKGFVLGFNGAFDLPGGDMADRFGPSYRVGAQVFYKFKSNWVVGPKFDFIFGSLLREDSLMANIQDRYGSFIGQTGQRIGVTIGERGYMIGMQGGKIFPIGKNSADNGVLALTTVGFMQHKIFIRDRDGEISALRDDYLKGYDRLTNGWFLEQYVGYSYISKRNILNFHIGLDLVAGFTAGRRNWLYDVRRAGTDSRLDMLFGIRGGWYIPIFRHKSEDIFFE